jgi:hypothetical protein
MADSTIDHRQENMRAGLQAAHTALEANATRESLDAVLRILVNLSAEDLKSQAKEARSAARALAPSKSAAYEAQRIYFLAHMDEKLYAMRAEAAASLSTSLSAAKSDTPVDRRELVRDFAKALKKAAGHVWAGLDNAGHDALAIVPQQHPSTIIPDPRLELVRKPRTPAPHTTDPTDPIHPTLHPKAHMQALLLRVRNL